MLYTANLYNQYKNIQRIFFLFETKEIFYCGFYHKIVKIIIVLYKLKKYIKEMAS